MCKLYGSITEFEREQWFLLTTVNSQPNLRPFKKSCDVPSLFLFTVLFGVRSRKIKTLKKPKRLFFRVGKIKNKSNLISSVGSAPHPRT